MSTTPVDVARLVRQIPTQYPFVLVDRVLEHDPKGRLVAVKNVTGSEEYFEGHFPQQPVMPGVLIMESLAQAAGIWLLHDAPDPAGWRSTWSASTARSSAVRSCRGTSSAWRCRCCAGGAGSAACAGR